MGPLITLSVHKVLRGAARAGMPEVECSLDLARSTTRAIIGATQWQWQGQSYPYLTKCKDRTVYYWVDGAFQPVSRFTLSLIKLIPTEWGPPTFEIDGIKMLPTAAISPYVDAQNKVELIQPGGKIILDTCGGLGYFADCCLRGGAQQVLSYEKNPDVVWLRSLNPWSPPANDRLSLRQGDISHEISTLPDASFDAVLHDPPRFGIAGELYAQTFYQELARVLKPHGRLFHYTGSPNKLTTGRDVPNEVIKRLRNAGFVANIVGDGVLAEKAR